MMMGRTFLNGARHDDVRRRTMLHLFRSHQNPTQIPLRSHAEANYRYLEHIDLQSL